MSCERFSWAGVEEEKEFKLMRCAGGAGGVCKFPVAYSRPHPRQTNHLSTALPRLPSIPEITFQRNHARHRGRVAARVPGRAATTIDAALQGKDARAPPLFRFGRHAIKPQLGPVKTPPCIEKRPHRVGFRRGSIEQPPRIPRLLSRYSRHTKHDAQTRARTKGEGGGNAPPRLPCPAVDSREGRQRCPPASPPPSTAGLRTAPRAPAPPSTARRRETAPTPGARTSSGRTWTVLRLLACQRKAGPSLTGDREPRGGLGQSGATPLR